MISIVWSHTRWRSVSCRDRGLQIVQATGRVAGRDVFLVDGAVHLLVHLEELVDRIAGEGVVWHGLAGHFERSRGQRVDVCDADIRTERGAQTRPPGAKQELVLRW